MAEVGTIDLDEKTIVDEGETVSPAQVDKAAEGYTPEPEPVEEKGRGEDKPDEKAGGDDGDKGKKVDTAEDKPEGEDKRPKNMPYSKWNEERRARKSAEAELEVLREKYAAAIRQETGKAPTPDQKEDINKLLAEDPARAIKLLAAQEAQVLVNKYKQETEQAQMQEKITRDSKDAYNLMLKNPEARDEDFEPTMLYLIEQNPAVGMMSAEKAAKFLMGEYRELRQTAAVQESRTQVEAKVKEGNRVAKLAVAQPTAGGNTGGKRTYKVSEIDGMLANAKGQAYNDLSAELDLAEQEGRIVR